MVHTKRMKAFNLEVEFDTREHKEIKVGQAHYLSGILENYDTLMGQFINEKKLTTYQDVMNVISYHYRSYFTKNFHRNLNFKIQPLNKSELSRSEHQLLKYITKENVDVGFQNRLLGNRTLLIGISPKLYVYRSEK